MTFAASGTANSAQCKGRAASRPCVVILRGFPVTGPHIPTNPRGWGKDERGAGPLPGRRKAAFSFGHLLPIEGMGMPGQPELAAPLPSAPTPSTPPLASIESLNPDTRFSRAPASTSPRAGFSARKALWATNQFFATLDRMLHDQRPPVFHRRSKFDDHGQVDGRLGDAAPGRDGRGMDAGRYQAGRGAGGIIGPTWITAAFFHRQLYAPAVKIEATSYRGDLPPDDNLWVTILCRTMGSAPSRPPLFKC